MIPLPQDWSACERGNIYLVGGDGEQHLAYFALPWDRVIRKDGVKNWLEVSLVPANYPAVNIAVVSMSDQELALHIQDNCEGWAIRKLNIEGVQSHDGIVTKAQIEEESRELGPEDEDRRPA